MGGDSSASNPRRQSSAELLVKGETQWRTVSAQFPVGPVREITGIAMNNKVYFIGKTSRPTSESSSKELNLSLY